MIYRRDFLRMLAAGTGAILVPKLTGPWYRRGSGVLVRLDDEVRLRIVAVTATSMTVEYQPWRWPERTHSSCWIVRTDHRSSSDFRVGDAVRLVLP